MSRYSGSSLWKWTISGLSSECGLFFHCCRQSPIVYLCRPRPVLGYCKNIRVPELLNLQLRTEDLCKSVKVKIGWTFSLSYLRLCERKKYIDTLPVILQHARKSELGWKLRSQICSSSPAKYSGGSKTISASIVDNNNKQNSLINSKINGRLSLDFTFSLGLHFLSGVFDDLKVISLLIP